MKLTSAVQEALVAILLYDASPGGAAVVAGLLSPAVYDAFYRDLAAEGIAYLEKYKQPAGEHTIDILDSLKARKPDDAQVFDRIYASLEQTRGAINREYIIGQAGVFAKHQRMRAGIVRAVDAIQINTAEGVAEAEKILQECLKGSYELFDPGVVFSDVARSLAFLNKDQAEAFPTGISQLDSRDLGPARKRLHLFSGSTGSGKTWWLIHLAKCALLNRLKVLYVTLEMSDDEILGRMMQSFFSITKREGEVRRQRFVKDKDGTFKGWEEEVLKNRPAFTDDTIREHLVPKVEAFKRRPQLIVKAFPSGQLTIPMLKGYLATLEGAIAFIPDLIIVDHLDLFDVSPANKRLELDKITVDLRGIAGERNVAMATATQLNAEGGQARTATKFHASEAKSKVHHADIFLTYNQTQEEYELGLARIFVAKGRSDEDKFSVLIAQSYKMGQFVLESTMMTRTYFEHFEKEFEVSDGEDE